jgi:hypothetical protein
MEQEAERSSRFFRNGSKGTYAVSIRHDECINGGIRFPGGVHAYAP